jgi:hypothetical protein
MFATWNASTQPALFAGRGCMQCKPSSMRTTCMTTPASTSIIGTGVIASVSLLSLLRTLILLVVLLCLSGLTGLLSLVGLTTGLALSTKQGD